MRQVALSSRLLLLIISVVVIVCVGSIRAGEKREVKGKGAVVVSSRRCFHLATVLRDVAGGLATRWSWIRGKSNGGRPAVEPPGPTVGRFTLLGSGDTFVFV